MQEEIRLCAVLGTPIHHDLYNLEFMTVNHNGNSNGVQVTLVIRDFAFRISDFSAPYRLLPKRAKDLR